MREPLRLVGVADDGLVVASVVLLPGTFRRLEGASLIMELPLGVPAPAAGTALGLFPMVQG